MTASKKPKVHPEGGTYVQQGEVEFLMNGTLRASVRPGIRVCIILKRDQSTGKLTEAIVKDILTKSPSHPHGIKVRLVSGEIGRVKEVLG